MAKGDDGRASASLQILDVAETGERIEEEATSSLFRSNRAARFARSREREMAFSVNRVFPIRHGNSETMHDAIDQIFDVNI